MVDNHHLFGESEIGARSAVINSNRVIAKKSELTGSTTAVLRAQEETAGP